MMRQLLIGLLLLFAAQAATAGTAVVWDDGSLNFTKSAFGTEEDTIIAGVSLTRGDFAGLFNAATEGGFTSFSSPDGTLWAFDDLDGNPTGAAFGAIHHDDLNYDDWQNALGGPTALAGNIVGRAGVLYVPGEDLYIDIMFTSWAQAGVGDVGGAFTYTRATGPTPPPPVPLPAALPLMLAGLAVVGARGRRKG